jgi:hypothetical protein
MIDTIILTLTRDQYQINNPNSFVPSASLLLSTESRGYSPVRAVQNTIAKELRAGIYKPKLTLAHRINLQGGTEVMLKVELSLPKLMFGNNFAELQYKDFKPLLGKLVSTLADMGVVTTAETLSQALVSVVHYSKNIAFTDGSIPYHYITKLQEANASLSLDVDKAHYRNDGNSYRWHCNAYEVVFYDKIKDLEKAKISRKRALEKGSELQLNVLKKLQKRDKLEILRMEVRLNK